MRIVKGLALLVAIPSALATAQQIPPATPPGPGAGATAIGVVYDSIRMRPLAGAIVRVDTSALAATADEGGRYRIEGIPPGQHFLRVEHPFLDTLTVVLRSPAESYVAGGTRVAELAVPSEDRFLQYVCTPAWRNRGPAALVGRVREADTGVPAVGAKVSLVWYEIEVTSGVRRAPRVREATVGPDGSYRLCGLPAELDGKVQVIRGPLTSGEITVTFGSSLLYLRNMGLASAIVAQAPAGDSTAAPVSVALGSATLRGVVLNNLGRPLANARVQLEGTTRVATSRADGQFVLDSLPAGTQNVSVRLLGYAPVEQAVDLVSSQPTSVTLKMAEFVPVLEQVRVTAQRERGLEFVGFTRRKRSANGHFFEEKDLNKNAILFSDVMRVVPGVRVAPAGNGRSVLVNSRDPNGCVNVWVDGTLWQQLEPGDVDDFVKPHELAAMEAYSPSNTPVEFSSKGGSCMTVIVWTVRRLDRRSR
jgi:hypothetical protein